MQRHIGVTSRRMGQSTSVRTRCRSSNSATDCRRHSTDALSFLAASCPRDRSASHLHVTDRELDKSSVWTGRRRTSVLDQTARTAVHEATTRWQRQLHGQIDGSQTAVRRLDVSILSQQTPHRKAPRSRIKKQRFSKKPDRCHIAAVWRFGDLLQIKPIIQSRRCCDCIATSERTHTQRYI